MTGNREAVDAVEQVQVLHSPRVFHGDGYGWTVCAECRQGWPCATAHAIDQMYGVFRHANGNFKSGPEGTDSWPFRSSPSPMEGPPK